MNILAQEGDVVYYAQDDYQTRQLVPYIGYVARRCKDDGQYMEIDWWRDGKYVTSSIFSSYKPGGLVLIGRIHEHSMEVVE